jgi:hypothetical protein
MSITIVNGVNELSNDDLAGQSVADVRRKVAQALNVDPEATAMVNGEATTASYVLEDGDELEFVKKSGVKGV